VTALPLASTSSTTIFAAFGAGFLSFVSPCVLPLVPGYLSTISGVAWADIEEGRKKTHILVPAVIFCISFSVMFILLGMTATGIGQTLQDNRALLRQISGLIIIFMGVFFIATLFVPVLNREFRPEGLMKRAQTGGPILAGLAFAVAWLPCTGATLGAVLAAASSTADAGKGALLLTFYSLGMAVPFLLSALAFTSVTGFFKFFRDHYAEITIVSGVILIAFGVLLYTNEVTRLNSEVQNLVDSLGINFFENI
jgi:cytochrome c-type biogenesis protein